MFETVVVQLGVAPVLSILRQRCHSCCCSSRACVCPAGQPVLPPSLLPLSPSPPLSSATPAAVGCAVLAWGPDPTEKEPSRIKGDLGFCSYFGLFYFLSLPWIVLQVQGSAHSQMWHSLSQWTETFGLRLGKYFSLWLGFTSYTLQSFFAFLPRFPANISHAALPPLDLLISCD